MTVEKSIAKELKDHLLLYAITEYETQAHRLITILYDRRVSFYVDRVWDGMVDIYVNLSEEAEEIMFAFDRSESFLWYTVGGRIVNQ